MLLHVAVKIIDVGGTIDDTVIICDEVINAGYCVSTNVRSTV